MPAPIRRPSRRAAIVASAAGLAVVGAVGIGAAAFAEGTPTPSTSQAVPSGAPSGAPTGAPDGRHGGPGGTHAPHIGGTVLTVSGSTVTVKDRDGFTRTITLKSGVKVTKGTATSSTSAIAKGVWIEASGTVDSNGTTLDATAVSIGRPTPPAGGPAGGPAGAKGERPTPPKGGSAPTPPTGGSTAPTPSTSS